MSTSNQMNKLPNLTHERDSVTALENVLEELTSKIIKRGDLPHVSVDDQLEIVAQLSEFPFGRFVLERRGANGFWTDYLIDHPNRGKISGLNIEGKPFNRVEDFMLNRCPVVLAHQERFQIYQNLIQKNLKEDMTLASIPCGLMRDLLTLDFSKFPDIKLLGIDIDQESLELAESLAKEQGVTNVTFLKEDAWKIKFREELDLITSSGLNVYEPDPNRVLELYHKFFSSLKPGGVLIISILTYPPGEDYKTDWELDGITQEDLLMEQILYKDILDTKWRNFRSKDELDRELKLVGFSKISIYFDKHKIFPTICAQK